MHPLPLEYTPQTVLGKLTTIQRVSLNFNRKENSWDLCKCAFKLLLMLNTLKHHEEEKMYTEGLPVFFWIFH